MKAHLRITIATLLANGASHREIKRRTGVDRKTIRRYAAARADSPGVATGAEAGADQNPPPRPPAPEPDARPPWITPSACEPHRAWIESQLGLGRNAQSLYQDLVEQQGFTHAYNSVKRFVAKLRAREPERFDVLEFLPGEEQQGKSFRKVAWKTDQESWSRRHEEAWRSFGGCCRYVVVDNLKEAVIRPDIYEPELNPVYAAMLQHYGVVADPCRVRDPDRKGSVENAIQHTQGTALKGRRFDSIEAQNAWLAHWEERWAAPRIHGRKKRQVLEMFREEQPHLHPLPLEGFRYFQPGTRTVDDAGLIQVDGSYYAALPAPLHSQVQVRIYPREIEILDPLGGVLRRHVRSDRKGRFVMQEGDRIFNPSRQSARLLEKAAKIGPQTEQLARQLFTRLGRPGQKALYGLTNLARTYSCAEIEAVCGRFLEAGCVSYQAIKQALERQAAARTTAAPALVQVGPVIRELAEYQSFWEECTQAHAPEE